LGATIDILALARQVQAGDRTAEPALVQHFGRRAFAMILARTRDADLAADLTQDTLLGMIVALRAGRVQELENLAGFVLGTAQNLIANHFRQQARRPEQHALPEEIPAPPAWDDHEYKERMALLERVLKRLDANEFQVLRMTLVDDLNPSEIALRLGLSPEAVRQRKSRALKKVSRLVKNIQSR
jgi:RNA polymerase sigma factor (sigma-70 family)